MFCLFSQSKDNELNENSDSVPNTAVWESTIPAAPSKEVSLEAMLRISEQNAAKALALDMSSSAIRLELEQKRRSFALLAELAVSLLQSADEENMFITVAKRINAALNMQRTVVLKRNRDGSFASLVLQGYSAQEKKSPLRGGGSKCRRSCLTRWHRFW